MSSQKVWVRFKQLAFRDDGLLVGLSEGGSIWLCLNMAEGEWQKIQGPEVDLEPTPTPTLGRPIKAI